MNYLDVYKARVSAMGANPQERAFNSGILEFRRYLKYNQHTVRGLKKKDSIDLFDGVILTDREDENRVSQILLVKIVEDGGPELRLGDLIQWNDDYWLIYRSTTSSYQPHQKFYMVKCNYFIKWVDKSGRLCSSWAYLLGSKDNKIKDNFRTWNNLITPQPNKYISLIMPHQLMAINTEIMVLDEVWYLVDYDQASVPGVIYMSFTETNFNEQRDSLEHSIANIDQLAEWTIEMAEHQNVLPNQIVDVNYQIYKNGKLDTSVTPIITVAGDLIMEENGIIKANSKGKGTVTLQIDDIVFEQQISILAAHVIPTPLFIGDTQIRVTNQYEYILENAENVEFTIDTNELATILEIDNNRCIIQANRKNKVGEFTLTAHYGDKVYSKNIKVVSLWQVI